MLKRLVPAALALAFTLIPLQAAATDYTDIWYLPAESGWGVNMVQSDSLTSSFIFATFFIYGSGNQPTWYTAQMTADVNGNYAGTLYATVGSYFAAPWNPGSLKVTAAGTASFVPSDAYHGTLTYSISGGPTVIRSIQRQSLTPIALAGSYVGGQSGAYGNGCGFAGSYTDTFNLTVTQPGDGTATLVFTYPQLTCTWSGNLVQYGKVYTMPNASYVCTDGTSSTATMNEIQATPYGIEAIFFAPSGSQGGASCSEAANFSGALE